MKIDNKVKAYYNSLLKEGYYLRPEKFTNTTIVSLTKDLHPVNCSRSRKTILEVNMTTAKQLIKMFGFKMVKPVEYFGKAEPIKNGMKRQYLKDGYCLI